MLLDLQEAPSPAQEILAECMQLAPPFPIIGLLRPCAMHDAVALMRAGAWALLDAAGDPQQLREAVKAALAADAARAKGRREYHELTEQLAKLTPREREVMELLTRGLSARDVALALGMSPHTVNVHRTRVLSKTHSDSMIDLTVRLARAGMLGWAGPTATPPARARGS